MKIIQLHDILKAKNRITPFINTTPIVTSSLLNDWLGHDIYFKAEGLQKVGAFKVRGALNTIAWLIEKGKKPKHIVANSSGNHSQAVAWAAKIFKIPATIYMPEYSSKVKIQATKSYGAKVVLCETRDIADSMVAEASVKDGFYWIPPYNHEQVISGQGSAVYEAIKEVGKVDAVIAPCGGGGLLAGSVIAAKGLLPNVKVIGAEPRNANDASLSLQKNVIQRLKSKPDTLADGAMTMSVGVLTFEYLKRLDAFYEIKEEQIIYWTQWLTHLLKLSIEPTSAMGMEAAKQWLQKQKTRKKVLIVLSGGNMDRETSLKIWKKDYLLKTPSL
ncbi:serine/threonine dehydratase [uncultured Maribacter sp.]|uniref:serine/threonine dehydratase n=1 Tax=uncultured Maribacter sp. TaxID=431308 RepID=UPI00260C363B|nr:serine/threonine dehydratase [uncultured Maribacter sp.]